MVSNEDYCHEETPPNFLLLSAARNDTDVWLLVIIIGFLALVFFLTGTGVPSQFRTRHFRRRNLENDL